MSACGVPAADAFDEYQRREYFPALDGARAVCVLGVICCHMADSRWWAWLSGGLGVNVFFVLSGFLITTLAVREERANGRVSLGAFYIRRSMRIFPLYYVALAVYAGLIYFTSWSASARDNFTAALPAYLFYFQEVPFAQDVVAAGRHSPFAHSWSLGIEEKYYLVWPVLGFVACRGLAGARLALAIGLCLVLTAGQSVGRLGPAVADWSLNFILYPYSQILCGCVLALLLDRPDWFRRLRVLGSAPGTVATVLVFAALQLAYNPFGTKAPELVVLHTLAATALVGSLVLGGGWLTRALSGRPMLFLGRLSYGMYLFHALGISLAQKLVPARTGRFDLALLSFALAVGASVAVAFLLSILVERPCIRLGRAWAKRIAATPKPAAATPMEAPFATSAGAVVVTS
jgi:peptidoglycan/LPS O-acetylase OafA/YrhL